MTEQKDKCPECKGTGMGQFDHNKNVRCDACNGTGQKKMDSLREKIKELEFKVPVPIDGEIEARYIHLEDRGINRIIALLEPLIEEAKKQAYAKGIEWGRFQERERMLKLIQKHSYVSADTGNKVITPKNWQALKEEK